MKGSKLKKKTKKKPHTNSENPLQIIFRFFVSFQVINGVLHRGKILKKKNNLYSIYTPNKYSICMS